MPQEETRLKSPTIDLVTPLIKKIDTAITDGVFPLKRDAQPADLTEEDMTTVQDCLEWIRTFLANRKDYHKKRQLQGKVERQLLEEALKGRGVDVAAIKREAAANVADTIVDESVDES